MNIRCCCGQEAAAYRTVLYPNHYSEAPGRERPADVASPSGGRAGGAAARGRHPAGVARDNGALGGAGRLPHIRPGYRPAVGG